VRNRLAGTRPAGQRPGRLVSRGMRDQAGEVVRDMREQLKRFPQFKGTMGKAWLAKAARLLTAK